MVVSKELFRKVLGHFPTGVTVVTARHASGKPWGFTANSFTSVSLEPPLILVCVDLGSESFKAISEAKFFAVNFLSQEQEDICRRFASKVADRFENVVHVEGTHGVPLLPGCLGFVECKKIAAHHYGDHMVVVGEVMEAKVQGGAPLLFYRSTYARLTPDDESSD